MVLSFTVFSCKSKQYKRTKAWRRPLLNTAPHPPPRPAGPQAHIVRYENNIQESVTRKAINCCPKKFRTADDLRAMNMARSVGAPLACVYLAAYSTETLAFFS